MLTERLSGRNEDESRYVQAVSETGFTLLELVATEHGHHTEQSNESVSTAPGTAV